MSARGAAAAFLKAPWLSPLGFLRAALWIAVLFGAAHALGLREHTRFLSGSAPPGEEGAASVALGLTYAFLYFAFVLAAPILIAASGVLLALERAIPRRPPPPPP